VLDRCDVFIRKATCFASAQVGATQAQKAVGHRTAELIVRSFDSAWVVVAPLPKVVAVRQRRQRALQWQDVQAVPRQVEIADDLGPQQAHHDENTENLKPGETLFDQQKSIA
jgi:hypothetical protein